MIPVIPPTEAIYYKICELVRGTLNIFNIMNVKGLLNRPPKVP